MRITHDPLTFDTAAAAAAIAALRASIRPEAGGRRRTIEDMQADSAGRVCTRDLAREVEGIAAQVGLCYEWIGPETDATMAEPRKFQRDWQLDYRRIDVAITQGHSEGWMMTIAGARRASRRAGDPETTDVLLRGKYLGCRFEATWLACAVREFLMA